MSFHVSEKQLFDNWPVDEVKVWINDNKPSALKSGLVAKKFLKNAEIKGDDRFTRKTVKLIEKASQTAVGAETLKRAIEVDKKIIFKPGKEFLYFGCRNYDRVDVNLDGIMYEISLNDKGERFCFKSSKVAILIHEILHYLQKNSDIIKILPLTSENMDKPIEEGAITGFLHLKNLDSQQNIDERIYDFCSENSLLVELGLPLRVNHRGINVLKGESLIKKIQFNREFDECLRNLMTSKESFISSEMRLQAAVALSMPKELQSLIDAGNESSENIYEFINLNDDLGRETLQTLIKNGIKPSHENFCNLIENGLESTAIKEILEMGVVCTDEILITLESYHSELAEEIILHILNEGILPCRDTFCALIDNGLNLELIKKIVGMGAALTDKILAAILFNNGSENAYTFLNLDEAQPGKLTLKGALDKGYMDIVQSLIQKGINLTPEMYKNILHKEEIVNFLLDNKILPSEETIIEVIQGYDNLLKNFLSKGLIKQEMTKYTRTIKAAEIFIDHGFSVHENEMIDLNVAIVRGSSKVTKHLIDLGVKPQEAHIEMAEFYMLDQDLISLLIEASL